MPANKPLLPKVVAKTSLMLIHRFQEFPFLRGIFHFLHFFTIFRIGKNHLSEYDGIDNETTFIVKYHLYKYNKDIILLLIEEKTG